MKNHRSLLLILSGWSLLSASAVTVTGRVLGLPENKTVQEATCSYAVNDSIRKSVMSDTEGQFLLEIDSIVADASVVITKQGYETLSRQLPHVSGPMIELGQILLEKTTTLSEVTVEGQAIMNSNGNMLYTPPKSIVESSHLAIDLLGKLGIPGLTYNPISRTVASVKGNPVILIDGVPSSQEDLLSIKPSQVLNVEYSDIVPAKYASMGSTFISIRLKERSNGGDWIINDMNDFTGNGIDLTTSLRLHQGPSRWRLGYDFSYRHYLKCYDLRSTNYLAPELPLSTLSDGPSPFTYRTNNLSFQYTYAPSENLLVTATYRLAGLNDLRKTFFHTDDTLQGEYENESRTHSDSWRHSLNVYVSKSLNKSNTIDVNIDASVNDQDYESAAGYFLPESTELYTNVLNSARYALNAMANYGHIFRDDSRLNATYFFTLSRTKNRYTDTGNIFRLSEFNQQIYLEYRRELLKQLWLYAKTGLSIDHVGDNDRPETFCNNISQINLNWRIRDAWNVGASASFNSSTLSLASIQDNLTQTSPYLFNNGNPDLRPSSTLNFGVSGNFAKSNYSFYARAAYVKSFNPILTAPVYDSSLHAYLSRPANARNSESYYSYIGGNMWNIFKMFQVNGLIQFRHDRLTDNSGWHNCHNSIGVNFMISWRYKKWGIDYMREFPIVAMNGYALSSGERYDGILFSFRPDSHWDLSLAWWYMFNKKGWTSDTRTISPDYTTSNHREILNNSNWIQLRATYNISFGSPFKGKERSRSLNVSDSQSTFQDYAK